MHTRSITNYNRFNLAKIKFQFSLFPTLGFLLVLPLLISLGFWQLDRADEKNRLLTLQQHRGEDDSVVINAESVDDPLAMRYRNITVSGQYDATQHILLDNRVVNGKPGYFVITPFRIQHSVKAVLVNRGWVPMNLDRTILPVLPKLNTQATQISGRINTFPRVGIKLQGAEIPTATEPAVVQLIDAEVLSKQLGYPLFGFQVELDPDMPDGFLRHWQKATVMPPEKHVAYAVQWFALALTLTGIFFFYSRKKEENDETN